MEYGSVGIDFNEISPFIWLYEWTGVEAKDF